MRNNGKKTNKQLWEFLWDHQKHVIKEIFNDRKKLLLKFLFTIVIPFFTFFIIKMISPLILSVKSEVDDIQKKYNIDVEDVNLINENLSSIHARIDLLITILVLVILVLSFEVWTITKRHFAEISKLKLEFNKIHDAIHRIRDGIVELNINIDNEIKIEENTLFIIYKNKLSKKEFIEDVLTQLKKIFNSLYKTNSFTASIMIVDNPEDPQFLYTCFYSKDTPIDRMKHRSYVPKGKGVAGKFIDSSRPRPRKWDIHNDHLYRDDYISAEKLDKQDLNPDINFDKDIEKDKDYVKGISSPFLVNKRVYGAINLDTYENDIDFTDGDIEIVRLFGDIIALIYQVDFLISDKKHKVEAEKLLQMLGKC